MTTKEICDSLGIKKADTVLNAAREVGLGGKIANGKATDWTEAEASIILEKLKTHGPQGGGMVDGEYQRANLPQTCGRYESPNTYQARALLLLRKSKELQDEFNNLMSERTDALEHRIVALENKPEPAAESGWFKSHESMANWASRYLGRKVTIGECLQAPKERCHIHYSDVDVYENRITKKTLMDYFKGKRTGDGMF